MSVHITICKCGCRILKRNPVNCPKCGLNLRKKWLERKKIVVNELGHKSEDSFFNDSEPGGIKEEGK